MRTLHEEFDANKVLLQGLMLPHSGLESRKLAHLPLWVFLASD